MADGGQREHLASRLGFLLLAAGCAVGLGNIWRFPYVAGRYGGATFILLYLFFLIVIGFPVLVMELAIGRGGQRNIVGAMRRLSDNRRWSRMIAGVFWGNLMLMMFYTTVCGWMFAYFWYYLSGKLGTEHLTSGEIGGFFNSFVSSSANMVTFMLITVSAGSLVCMAGLRAGVERVTKMLMGGLFLLLIVLVAKSVSLEGASAGLEFYLAPKPVPAGQLMDMLIAALGQAFFTLSLGIGSMAIFGSYVDKSNTLTGEALSIIGLDTVVALMAGLIIFPACFAFGVPASSGPELIFVTLPNIFGGMAGGRWWGVVFFLFMSAAALTTVIAVFENIIAWMMDELKFSRRFASAVNFAMVALLSLPCALGFNLFKEVQPFGAGSTILDFEDFLVSDTLLPLGSLIIVFFCTIRYGWGWTNFLAEANAGKGLKYPKFIRWYVTMAIPAVIIVIFAVSYYNRFFA